MPTDTTPAVAPVASAAPAAPGPDGPLLLDDLTSPEYDDYDCYSCGDVLPGALTDMDFPGGITRCDDCQLFAGDLDAALAVAALLGGTVWFMAESPRTRLPEGRRTQFTGTHDAMPVAGNNPWVTLDDVPLVWAHTRLMLQNPREVIITANKMASTWKHTPRELVDAARAVHLAPAAA